MALFFLEWDDNLATYPTFGAARLFSYVVTVVSLRSNPLKIIFSLILYNVHFKHSDWLQTFDQPIRMLK